MTRLRATVAAALAAAVLTASPASAHGMGECLVHRGHSGYADDNTAPDWSWIARTYPTDGVEGDLRVSADGSVWAYHDFTLASSTTGTGAVEDHGDAYLAGVRYLRFGGHLSQLYPLVAAHPRFELLEVKVPTNAPDRWTAAVFLHVWRTLVKLHATTRVWLYGFSKETLLTAHAAAPGLRLAWGSQKAYADPSWIAAFGVGSKVLFTAVNPPMVARYHAAGLRVIASQMSEPWSAERQRGLASEVDGYVVSHPKDCVS